MIIIVSSRWFQRFFLFTPEPLRRWPNLTDIFYTDGLVQPPTRYCLGCYINVPGTQKTLVLIGKDLVLEGSTTKIEDKQVPGRYRYMFVPLTVFKEMIRIRQILWIGFWEDEIPKSRLFLFLSKPSANGFWPNYSDLTRPHPKLWFSKGI